MSDLNKVPRRRGFNLVAATTKALREQIFTSPPGVLLGSLHELARELEVGVVTLQQAARVLEHEGLLEVRRGPGGGYYGARPDDAALERALDSYLRVHPSTYEEALNITSLLFNELVPAATKCTNPTLIDRLSELSRKLEPCVSNQDCGDFEVEFQELLFNMVNWPLFKMLTVATLRFGVAASDNFLLGNDQAIAEWKLGRRRIIRAILEGDSEIARFEANRSNRRVVLRKLLKTEPAG